MIYRKLIFAFFLMGEGCSAAYGHEIYVDHKDEFRVTPRTIDWYQVLRDRKTGRTYSQFEYDNVTNTLSTIA